MSSSNTAAPAAAARPATAAKASPVGTTIGRSMPRILRVTDPAPSSWAATLGQAATHGFDTLLLPPCLRPPALMPANLASAATGLGIALLCDVDVRTVTAAWLADRPGPFTRLAEPTLDPRGPSRLAAVATATVATAEDAEALAGWWTGMIATAIEAGLSGVRLLGLGGLPGWALPGFLATLRAGLPGAVLFADTAGLAWPVLRSLPARTLDLVASSLPFWDGRSDWLWTELGILRGIGAVVAEAGAHADREALAAILAEGWMTADGSDRAEALNATRTRDLAGLPWSVPVSPAGSGTVCMLRTDAPDPRRAHRAALATTAIRPGPPISAAVLLSSVSADFGRFTRDGDTLAPDAAIGPAPGTLLVHAASLHAPSPPAPLVRKRAEAAAQQPRVAIERPAPTVEDGRFPARQIVGTTVAVTADIVTDGHDHLSACVRYRAPGEETWHEVPMEHHVNDRWTASFPLTRLGIHHYVVEAWKDNFGSYVGELQKKWQAGVPIALELREGAALVVAASERSRKAVKSALGAILRDLDGATPDQQREILLAPATTEAMARADERPYRATTEAYPVQAERTAAGFASWYEVFPRSLSDDEQRHGTFRDVVRHLPRVQAMGFDVLYFPPFHPIGAKNRKGRNNTLTPAADDPGSPYAIGSAEGGHTELHPELGSIEDFQHLRNAAAAHGIELAMDFAIQCSPDHPWLQQHKEWFTWRPDGTIRYAENPPKRYEDIVNVDFYGPGAAPDLWLALADAVLYWAGQGIRLFRVDNPHTKPLPFWEWMIAEVQGRYPDAVFLAEAFTRPKVMYRLAKVGFSQSYTYFTWRSTPAEFRDYLTELTEGPPRDFFRPHFFVNTPDINPVPLQTSPRSGFLTRAALAATLSGLWGVYNGFELCEATPVPGREEYLDSEKYQLRAWDWERPGNIVAEIAQLNAIRKANPALHTHLGITFLRATNPEVLLFEKATPDRSNVILVAINTNLTRPHDSWIEVPFWRWTPEPQALDATDLVSGQHARWTERDRFVSLRSEQPYAIWRLSPAETAS